MRLHIEQYTHPKSFRAKHIEHGCVRYVIAADALHEHAWVQETICQGCGQIFVGASGNIQYLEIGTEEPEASELRVEFPP
jgi:hypothetical protein